jgi:PPOX class probable F420-dependent enzyme
MNTMSDDERRAFLMSGTRTGILSTVRADGRPHAAPVWFVLDGDVVVFMTGAGTVKGRNLVRSGQATITVDIAEPPFAYVSVGGAIEVSTDLDAMLPWSIKLAARYMGDEQAEAFGRRNAVEGELLLRLTPDNTVAFAGVAD